MISIDDVATRMDSAIMRATKLLGYEFSDNHDAVSVRKTFPFSQHGAADLIPVSSVNAFVSKVQHWLHTNPIPYPMILSFCIEGPETVGQTCFLNGNAHPHHVWNVGFEFME